MIFSVYEIESSITTATGSTTNVLINSDGLVYADSGFTYNPSHGIVIIGDIFTFNPDAYESNQGALFGTFETTKSLSALLVTANFTGTASEQYVYGLDSEVDLAASTGGIVTTLAGIHTYVDASLSEGGTATNLVGADIHVNTGVGYQTNGIGVNITFEGNSDYPYCYGIYVQPMIPYNDATVWGIYCEDSGGYFGGPLSLADALIDGTGSAGTSGYVLSSTVTGTKWIAGGGGGSVTLDEILDPVADTILDLDGYNFHLYDYENTGTSEIFIESSAGLFLENNTNASTGTFIEDLGSGGMRIVSGTDINIYPTTGIAVYNSGPSGSGIVITDESSVGISLDANAGNVELNVTPGGTLSIQGTPGASISLTGGILTLTTINGIVTAATAAGAVVTQTIASGTQALGTSLIASGAAATIITTAAAGVLATDNLLADFNADPTSTTGYEPSANGMLTIIKFCTVGYVNFYVVNNTANSITPGAVTLNWRVVR